MRRIPPLVALVLVLVLAACGGSSSKPYTAAATKACLSQKGFTGVTSSQAKIGFIAAFAPNGGLQARSKSGNVLTIAFADSDSVASTESAFKRNAPASLRPHISDIMSAKGNAVLVWTVSPSQQELSDAQNCLAP
ncbi:MAG TPA: hypothetical protein VGG88_10445 [Gaiellaceae bacterium]